MQKMKLFLSFGVYLFFLIPSFASEQILSGPEIQTTLSENVFIGEHNDQPTEQIYRASGDTFYSENGNQSQGRWEVRSDEYCSVWPPSSHWSCFAVAKDGDTIIFTSKSGQRYVSALRR